MKSPNMPDGAQSRFRSMDNMDKNVITALAFGKNTDSIVGFIQYTIIHCAAFPHVIFRFHPGERAFPKFWLLLIGPGVVIIISWILNAFSMVPLIGVRVDFALFHWFNRVILVCSLAHWGWMIYRIRIRRDVWYSLSNGESWLWLLYADLAKRYPVLAFLVPDQGAFQRRVEPQLVALLGLLCYFWISGPFGLFVIFLGMCSWVVGQKEYDNLRNIILDMQDASIVNAEVLTINDRSELSEQQRHNGFAVNRAILNEQVKTVRRVQPKTPLDHELEALRKAQTL